MHLQTTSSNSDCKKKKGQRTLLFSVLFWLHTWTNSDLGSLLTTVTFCMNMVELVGKLYMGQLMLSNTRSSLSLIFSLFLLFPSIIPLFVVYVLLFLLLPMPRGKKQPKTRVTINSYLFLLPFGFIIVCSMEISVVGVGERKKNGAA